MIPDGERRIFAATVKEGVVEVERGLKVTFNIPVLSPKFATQITGFTKEQGEVLKPGLAFNLVLSRGKKKPKREGKDETDGTQEWHYYWDWVGFAKADAEPTQGSTSSAPRQPAKDTNGNGDYWAHKDRQINACWALNQGRELAQYFHDWPGDTEREEGEEVIHSVIIEQARWFLMAKDALVEELEGKTPDVPKDTQDTPKSEQEQAFEDLGKAPETASAPPETGVTILKHTDFWKAAHERYGEGQDVTDTILALFDKDIAKWIKAGVGRDWQMAWDHVCTNLKVG